MPFTIGPRIHNVIASPLRSLIDDFFSLTDWKGLYLTGGTCLAEYYFGHRMSYDMDLFTAEESLFKEAIRMLEDPASFSSGKVTKQRTSPHLAQFLFQSKSDRQPIKVDIMLDTAPHFLPSLQVGNVWIDSLDDLLANKLGCMVQRNEVKDYLDLFYLIPASHMTTKELVVHALKKEGGFDPVIVAGQMEFLLRAPPPEAALLGRTPWDDLQLFFQKVQRELLELVRPA